jgi:hypothetical protein
MKQFSDDYIARLNEQAMRTGGGLFVKTAVVFEALDGSNNKYFAHAARPFVHLGNTYNPLPMHWEGLELSNQLQLPVVRVTVPSLEGTVNGYLEETDILGHHVVLRILHLDATPDLITDLDDVTLQIMAIEGDFNTIIFTLGLDLSLNEALPRHVVTRNEYPAVPDNMRRATIL